MSDHSHTVEQFLEGGAIAVAPARIESALRALWEPVTATGSDEPPAATRVSLGTEVVVTSAAREAVAGAVLGELTMHYPSRAVLVVVDPTGELTLEAAISASCHLVEPGRPQVCSERIRLRCGLAALDRLPGAVLPLLEADVPATLWWDLPTPPPTEVAAELARAMDRCLIDLTVATEPELTWRVAGAAGWAPLADLAWHRAARWREAAATLFDGFSQQSAAGSIERIEVVARGGTRQGLWPAALLAGWAAGQLGWQPRERQDLPPTALGGDTRMVSRTLWQRPSGDPDGQVRVALMDHLDDQPGRLLSLTLLAPSERAGWHLERVHDRPRELRLTAHHAAWCRLPSRLDTPPPEPLEVLLQALTNPAHNPVRERAQRFAAWVHGWG